MALIPVVRHGRPCRTEQVFLSLRRAGHVRSAEIRPVERDSVLACTITDTSGKLTALFYGRTHITGLHPGSNVQLRGPVSITAAGAVMINPAYELLD